jgi:pyruvate dehydrogenase E2 component (dihydrolipoamide acetyltransferase)
MPTDVIMPKMGLTMEAGTVQRWLAATGELLEAGQPLLEIETDKVVLEVETPAPGFLGPVLVPEGESVPIGTLLARVYSPGEPQAEPASPGAPQPEDSGPASDVVQTPRVTPLARRIAAGQGVSLGVAQGSGPGGRITAQDVQYAAQQERAFSSPRARKRAREANLDWRMIPGSGPRGRVIERDVLQAAAGEGRTAKDQEPGIAGQAPPAGDITWETPSPVQRVTAGRLAASFSTAPHFYLSAEARADALLELRERLQPVVERRAGVRLTVTDLLAKIVATALQEHPRANAFWEPEGAQPHGGAEAPFRVGGGGRIGLHRQVHLGLAVATDAGLVVPVLRDAGSLGLAQIAAERNRLVEKAREGKLAPDDMNGSTFTLTNLGMYRVDVFQAILNPPQSGILAVGRIAERPVVVEGHLCVRPTVVVTLSCDHRVLDGVLGAQFLGRVVELIEDPYELMA